MADDEEEGLAALFELAQSVAQKGEPDALLCRSGRPPAA